MKIAQLEARVIGNPWKNWVLVKLVTDEGLVGWGDATTPMTYKPVMAALEELCPLCLGRDPRQIERLMATRRIDIVQPEYVELGGIHRLRQVAAVAEAYQGMIAPHNARCPISTAVNVQVDAATRNVFIQETFDDFHIGWARELFEGIPAIEDGYLTIPERPGIGVEVNEEFIDRHPPGDRNYLNLFRSGWERRTAN